MLSLPAEASVPPVADCPPESASLTPIRPPPQDVEAVHSEPMISLPIEESASPLVEELGPNFLVDVVPHKILIFIILVNEIHSISVPLSEGVSLTLSLVVVHDLDKLHDPLLEVAHLVGAALDLLESVLGTTIEGLTHDLEKQFSGKKSNMRFISADNISSLTVHSGDVVLITSIKLVHLAHQVVSLLREESEILLKSPLLSLRTDGSFPHHLKLAIELSQPVAVTIVLGLKLSELLILPEEV